MVRSRLFDRLQRGSTGRLVLLSAPAGYGKTTLVASWLRQFTQAEQGPTDSRPHICWLSLDDDDNRLRRFFAGLAAALQPDLVGETKLAELLQLPQPVNGRSLALALIQDVTAVDRPLYLILDDYHVITQTDIHDALAYLLDRMPPHFHLLLTTRSDPPLPLRRQRSR